MTAAKEAPIRITITHRSQGGIVWRALLNQDELTEADLYLGDQYLHTIVRTVSGELSTRHKAPAENTHPLAVT